MLGCCSKRTHYRISNLPRLSHRPQVQRSIIKRARRCDHTLARLGAPGGCPRRLHRRPPRWRLDDGSGEDDAKERARALVTQRGHKRHQPISGGRVNVRISPASLGRDWISLGLDRISLGRDWISLGRDWISKGDEPGPRAHVPGGAVLSAPLVDHVALLTCTQTPSDAIRHTRTQSVAL